jgi:hypothetical protein
MCRFFCLLATPGNADGLCGPSDPAVLACAGVSGLSLIALIAWVRWQGVYPSARDKRIAKPELLDRKD